MGDVVSVSELSAKQLERIEAFELRAQYRREQGRPVKKSWIYLLMSIKSKPRSNRTGTWWLAHKVHPMPWLKAFRSTIR